jgi:hypothetical protein
VTFTSEIRGGPVSGWLKGWPSFSEQRAQLLAFETRGQECHRSLNARDIVAILYSVEWRDSIEHVRGWVEFARGASFLLIGAKSDSKNRKVSFEEGEGLAEKLGLRFLETSARTGEGVTDAFDTAIRELEDRPSNERAKAFLGVVPRREKVPFACRGAATSGSGSPTPTHRRSHHPPFPPPDRLPLKRRRLRFSHHPPLGLTIPRSRGSSRAGRLCQIRVRQLRSANRPGVLHARATKHGELPVIRRRACASGELKSSSSAGDFRATRSANFRIDCNFWKKR